MAHEDKIEMKLRQISKSRKECNLFIFIAVNEIFSRSGRLQVLSKLNSSLFDLF